jgi:hypothetical protein
MGIGLNGTTPVVVRKVGDIAALPFSGFTGEEAANKEPP